MPARSRLLCVAYIAIAIVALVLTWSQNLAYFGGPSAGSATVFSAFLADAAANPAARSVTFDIVLIFYAAAVWMVFEARRLRIRFVWAYVILGLLVAISVTFPLFLAAREMRGPVTPDIEGRPNLVDGIGLGLLTAAVAYLCGFVWLRA